MKNNKSRRNIVIIFTFLLFAIIYVKFNYVCIFNDIKVDSKVSVGIIDGKSFGVYDDIVYNKETCAERANNHGDAMIQFAKEICPKAKIFYYDASDEEDKITDEKIIEGIEWMIDNDVQYVNISLSSKKYSDELNEIIQSNKAIVNIYSSYNNLVNSFDYPSMYENVIASGFKNKNITYKNNDVIYHSNKVIVFPYDYQMKYVGNSYLSMITMLQEVEKGDSGERK